MSWIRRAAPLAGSLLPGAAFHAWFNALASYPTSNGRQFTLFDDAMISLTYARTLARTGELVWFPGAPRVQGFTNLLWTLYMAAVQALGLSGSAAALAIILTNEALLFAAALLTYILIRRLVPGSGRLPALLACGALPLMYPLTFWSLRGMETGLIAVVCLALGLAADAALVAWRDGRSGVVPLGIVAASSAIGVLTRLDVALFGGVTLVALLRWAPGRRLPAVASAGVALGLAAASVLVFQQGYYGDWLPNTYHLKMEGVPLTDRLLRGVITEAKAVPLLALGGWGFAAMWRWGSDRTRRLALLCAALVLAAAGYSVWVGGDAWEERLFVNRYQAVVLPLILALLVAGIAAATERAAPLLRTRFAAAASVGAAGLGIAVFPSPLTYLAPLGPLLGAALALTVLLAGRGLGQPAAARRGASALTLGLFAFWLASSLVPTASMLGGNIAGEDRAGTTLGQLIAQSTAPSARIAVAAAGSVAYYAERPMVDLLGKSDRRIALGPVSRAPLDPERYSPAFSTLSPGHNKWDFDYSLGVLKPDVATYLWGDGEARADSLGYAPACLGDFQVWVRRDSITVDRERFVPCAARSTRSGD